MTTKYLKKQYNCVCPSWMYLVSLWSHPRPQVFNPDSRGIEGQKKKYVGIYQILACDNRQTISKIHTWLNLKFPKVILFLFCRESIILVWYIFEISYGTNFVCLSDLVLLLQGNEFELFAFDKIRGLQILVFLLFTRMQHRLQLLYSYKP